MGAYQKESKPVKQAAQVIGQEAVIEKASQLMENEVGELAGEKG